MVKKAKTYIDPDAHTGRGGSGQHQVIVTSFQPNTPPSRKCATGGETTLSDCSDYSITPVKGIHYLVSALWGTRTASTITDTRSFLGLGIRCSTRYTKDGLYLSGDAAYTSTESEYDVICVPVPAFVPCKRSV